MGFTKIQIIYKASGLAILIPRGMSVDRGERTAEGGQGHLTFRIWRRMSRRKEQYRRMKHRREWYPKARERKCPEEKGVINNAKRSSEIQHNTTEFQ